MMEIDHMSYIFGSFARRRQSQDVVTPRRCFADPPKISHDRSASAPHTSRKTDLNVARGNFTAESKFRCPVCRRMFVEPRVLPCLHTFCTKCLLLLEREERSLERANEVSQADRPGSFESGHVSNVKHVEVLASKMKTTLTCPNCNQSSKLPIGGILGLPPNYLMQHRMVLATLNSSCVKLLCDVCTSDIPASSRCSECALSLCQECTDDHRRQKSTASHDVLDLESARRKGITRVRRQVMCSTHPERDLVAFCSSCYQVVCRNCISDNHRGHVHEPIQKAIKHHLSKIKLVLNKTRTSADRSSDVSSRFQATSKHSEEHYKRIENEIENFSKSYLEAVEKHRKDLLLAVDRARVEKLRRINRHCEELQKTLSEAKEAVAFTDELLSEGTDVEILGFVGFLLKKLEMCAVPAVPDLKISESLQFLPDEVVKHDGDASFKLYGVVTTQMVSPKHSVLLTEGVQNIRVGRKAEIVLECRDNNDDQIQYGGEQVTAELKHCNCATMRSLTVTVSDDKNGTYKLGFVPDIAGRYLLAVTIKGEHVLGSPHPITVRPFRPHHGIFHCCTFCSSGGSKEASCGCGGQMPGGYKGCGHGHVGHPGRRHWSCCGNTAEYSECIRRNSAHYQITL